MRTLYVPPGIGDSLWIVQKLLTQSERFDFCLPGGKPRRGHQVFELLPDLCRMVSYKSVLNYKTICENAISGNWSDHTRRNLFVSANSHLEAGKRIEEFLPDLDTVFKIDYATTLDDATEAAKYTEGNCIAIYTSAYSNARNWNCWQAAEWMELINRIHQERPDFKFVLIGASYDTGVELNHPALISTVGEPLSVVIEILKQCVYFIGFPSGLSILNETLGKDTFMFYPTHLEPMINTWADPKRIHGKEYIGQLMCDVDTAYNRIIHEYKLYDRVVAS